MGSLFKRSLLAAAVAGTFAASGAAHATNGMDLEGYGPIATAMGGASIAYDNGTSAMMNNPATLGLMAEGSSRLDIAVGKLGPDVTSTGPAAYGSPEADSDGTAYYMPAAGWAMKNGKMTYGVGLFAQGGMGTEYDDDTWMGGGTGQDARSEVSVGRFMVPFAYDVTQELTLAASADFVWGGMDMKMPMPIFNPISGTATPGTFADFFTDFGGSQIMGEGTVTPGLATALGNAVAAGYDTVALNFSNSSDYTGEASATGYGFKLGALYKVNSNVTLGAMYQSETNLGDWKGDGEMVMYDVDGANPAQTINGKVKIKDFQWPATYGVGAAYSADRWMVAGDIKVIQWSGVMKDFKLTFTPDGMSGESADLTMYQDWDDQTVFELGGAYKATDQLTLRAGVNIADNPIPNSYVNPLFPAIVEDHYTAGVGYAFNQQNDLNFSLTYAPEVKVTNSNTGVEITHSQLNWQLMYSYMF